jgi:DNA-binding IclR family transcriptional regulator
LLDVGSRSPATSISIGLALLAGLDDGAIAAATGLAAPELALTMGPIRHFRAERWVELACTSVPGITAISAAVAPPDGREPPVGFSLAFPDAAADAELRQAMAVDLARAARDIMDLVGAPAAAP